MRFSIQDDQFLLDGKPFQIISATVHYFRIVPGCWEDRLRKVRAMGCNTVETYVPWNLHEPQHGVYDFSGRLDIVRFLKTVQSLGLYAIVRPSPFICAEWEFGGQPAWLLAGEEPIPVRTREGEFLHLMDRYYGALFPLLAPLQIDAGGPILMMQVENEYGAFGCDKEYLAEMGAIMRRHGATVPFMTSDNYGYDLTRGTYEGALPTGNFGSGAAEKFDELAKVNRGGPLMCAEFWDGWFDAWGDEAHHTTDAAVAARELDEVLRRGSVNLYMGCGGTNFGFTSGANYYEHLAPDVTSYDYDAPIAEDGSLTEKFHAFRKVIGQYTTLPELDFPPVRRAAYGALTEVGCVDLRTALPRLSTAHDLETPCGMERLGQNFGYILYRHTLQRDIATLRLDSARDRVQVFADGKPVLTLYDLEIPGEHPLALPAGTCLELLVENMGRVNYGPHLNDQRKGIVSPVLADGEPLDGWQAFCLPLDDLSGLEFASAHPTESPAFHRFVLHLDAEPADTWLDYTGWGKGCAFVNGFALGRYWHVGPQRRLYLPGPLLHAGDNEIILFETDGPAVGEIVLTDAPAL